MGFLANLSKESNVKGIDWNKAYWCIDTIRIDSNQQSVVIELNAYPSRESRLMQNQPLVADYGFGTPSDMMVDGILYTWQGCFSLKQAFPNGIPISLDKQKAILYPLVKDYLGLSDWEDVIEEADNG